MKKLFPFFIAFFTLAALSAQTTATNFTCNDCSGNSHTLFTELDSGKVIVLIWVMPCPGCIAGGLAVDSITKSYAISNPGIVKFYLADDFANSVCHNISSWVNLNNLSPDAEFSDTAISMAHYGTAGMPKIIVLGGSSHTVFYNQSGTPSAIALQTAINNALSANAGIIERDNNKMGLTLFPNPALNNSKIKYTLARSADVTIEVMNLLGKKIKTFSLGIQSAGKQEYQINLESLSNGLYFTRLTAGEISEIVEVTVIR